MKLITASEFIEKHGLDDAKEVISDSFFKRDLYYCHVYKSGFLNMTATYSDRPNIKDAEWIKLSDLEDYLKDMEQSQ